MKIGERYRIGGERGCIMTVQAIHGDDITFVDGNSTFYYHKGDCSLIPVCEYVQLSLFGGSL